MTADELSNAISETNEKVEESEAKKEVDVVFDIEIRVKKPRYASIADNESLKDLRNFVKTVQNVYNWKSIEVSGDELSDKFERIVVSCAQMPDKSKLSLNESDLIKARVHAYATRKFNPMPQDILLNGNAESASVGSHHYEMPCHDFEDLWENLVYDDNIKHDLLSYALSLLKLSDYGANSSILSINRIILLHGPPGTGKTSLCKAIAQRLSIRLSSRYKNSVLIEVNSHSLFSKWFSESGKLVAKLFEDIEELATDPKFLVFVLIDEVESLTIGRNSAFSGADPSDSVRAVNAVLTQLDKIKRFPNVLILATSNISTALDSAFMDRTDICRYVGNPTFGAAHSMLFSSINELLRIGAINDGDVCLTPESENDLILTRLSKKCAGMSGRCIRKLPVLAYSKTSVNRPSLAQFLDNLDCAIDETLSSAKATGNMTNGY